MILLIRATRKWQLFADDFNFAKRQAPDGTKSCLTANGIIYQLRKSKSPVTT